ncbi:unnamed protein product [Arabis nemorensis]|uniref:PA domain-containing protein n=1 Tax=Arabis nemorensis TaxID=586526 RepID=A0A565CS46_9BRAS|nr:unnamed protein product [Arabis nemorensis]
MSQVLSRIIAIDSFCVSGCVDRDLVKGNIVLCDDFLGNKEAYLAGATGAIVQNTEHIDSRYRLCVPISGLFSEL